MSRRLGCNESGRRAGGGHSIKVCAPCLFLRSCGTASLERRGASVPVRGERDDLNIMRLLMLCASLLGAAFGWQAPLPGSAPSQLLASPGAVRKLVLPRDGADAKLLRSSSPEMMPIGVPKVSLWNLLHPSRAARCEKRLATHTCFLSCLFVHFRAYHQVAYKVPGANTADWVEIYNRLYREVRSFALPRRRLGNLSASFIVTLIAVSPLSCFAAHHLPWSGDR